MSDYAAAELGDFGNFLHFWHFVHCPVCRPVRQPGQLSTKSHKCKDQRKLPPLVMIMNDGQGARARGEQAGGQALCKPCAREILCNLSAFFFAGVMVFEAFYPSLNLTDELIQRISGIFDTNAIEIRNGDQNEIPHQLGSVSECFLPSFRLAE